MHVRDAVETDTEALSGSTRVPETVLRNAIHDRTVRVAEGETESDGDPGADGDSGAADDTRPAGGAGADGDRPVVAFVSFDARPDAVHVTHLDGDRETFERLLDEPVRFARSVGLPVQMLVPESEETVREAVESFGFECVGDGPRFDGSRTRRYVFDT